MPYHLVVSIDSEAYADNSFTMPIGRCLEYSDPGLRDYFFRFGETRIDELLAFPALLAHEECVTNPQVHLVRLTEILKRRDVVRAKFDPVNTQPLSYNQLAALSFELDIDGFEYSRTHWAIKNVDLLDILSNRGIAASSSAFPPRPYVDLEQYAFPVALSFPGEDRDLAQDIASRLEQRLGPNSCFYDFHYQAFLARPSLDTLLQTIYRNADLNVVFLSENYERKRWCSGIEFRAIREIIANRQHNRIMFIRTGDGDVTGVFESDGWIDCRQYSPDQIAFFIEQRARVPRSASN